VIIDLQWFRSAEVLYAGQPAGILVDFSEITAILFDSQQILPFHAYIDQFLHNEPLFHIVV
jgi:hypothetical protein